MEDALLHYCLNNPHNRHWWFRVNKHLPLCYSVLDSSSRTQLLDFFVRSESSGLRIGDCNVPCISFLASFVLSNNVTRIASLGHSLGYSVILLAMYARIKNTTHAIYSVDIDREHTDFASRLIAEFGLAKYAHLETRSSIDPNTPVAAKAFFAGQGVDLLFIDTKHEYQQTIEELRLWYPLVRPGGLVALHDASDKAKIYDASGQGVQKAVLDYCAEEGIGDFVILNKGATERHSKADLVYLDGCGLGLIQKPLGSS